MRIEVGRFFRFLAVGLLNTGCGYFAYAALLLMGSAIWVAVLGATIFGLLFNFMSYGGMVFGNTKLRLLPRFVIFYAGVGLLNAGLLRALAELDLSPLLAQALILPLLAIFSYVGLRLLVFRGNLSAQSRQQTDKR